MPATTRQNRRELAVILGAALALRLVLAVTTEGYPYDMSCFVAWGDKLASYGPASFYSEGYFADYPPGYLLVLGLIGLVRHAFSIAFQSPLTYLLLALLPALCDCAGAALVFWVARRFTRSRRATLCLTLFAAFNPLTLFDTGVWKQIDGALTLPLALCFLLLEGKNYLAASFCYGVALAIKPQALLLGPVLALCFLAGVADAYKDGTDLRRALGRIPAGAALALAPVLLAGLPFYGVTALLPSLVEKYIGTTQGYPYATINAFNWFAALGGNWAPLGEVPFFLLDWGTLGTLNLLLFTALTVLVAVRSWRRGRFSPLLLAAFYGAGVFTVGHCMHERYMVPAVLLCLLAAARWDDLRLYGAAFGFSLLGFVNLAAVYTLVGSDDEWLSSATSRLFASAAGLAQTACFVLLALTVWELSGHGKTSPLPKKVRKNVQIPTRPPRWTWREGAALAFLTGATAILSFAYLGDFTAPQNPVDANGTVFTATVQTDAAPTELWIYPGISTSGAGKLTVTDAAGAVVLEHDLVYTSTFTWTRQPLSGTGPYTVTLRDGMVMELCFKDETGQTVGTTGEGGAFFDEQSLVPEAISQLNSMYFDEIYHGRTAYEHLHRMPVYETTHPPMGKNFIMLGIALFGMTGFGWRCAGALFGVLLVPLAWCFARRLTGKRWVGAVCGALLALDFMRFAQSRIATIDIYGTFFILLGAHCMVWYCQSVLQNGVGRSLLPMALGGLAFGLGCASKWTGIYAGVGLAVLYLGVLWLRWRQRPEEYWSEFRTAAVGGVLFYVLLPLCVYIAGYLPYWWRDPGFTLRDWWNCQTHMFGYHAGLEASHPFESRWYTWLLGLRPVWYYRNGELPDGWMGSIAGLSGPVLTLAGLVCILLLLWRQVSGRGSYAGAGVLILYGAQLIPWMLVPRCTFLYHYFPSSMFCLAAIGLVLADTRSRRAAGFLLGLAVVLFVWYYPPLSGLPVPELWATSTRMLPSFGFY